MGKQSSRIPLLWPFVAILLATGVLRVTDLDSAVCRQFFGGDGHWPLLNEQPYLFFYEYGPLPGYAIGIAGFSVWLATLRFNHDLARRGFFCGMLVLLGPGLIVNGILKPNVQRPRPCQSAQFAGVGCNDARLLDSDLLASHDLGEQQPISYKSFPSGHASMGFATLAIPFLLRRRRKLFLASLSLSVSWGLCVGISRVIQGRHYPSDVLWSAGIVYVLAVSLYYLCGLEQTAPITLPRLLRSNSRKRKQSSTARSAGPQPTVVRFPTLQHHRPTRGYSLAGSAKVA